MHYFRLILSIVLSLILITLLVEMIEFSIVALVSGQSFSEVPQDQEAHFFLEKSNHHLNCQTHLYLHRGIHG